MVHLPLLLLHLCTALDRSHLAATILVLALLQLLTASQGTLISYLQLIFIFPIDPLALLLHHLLIHILLLPH